MGAVDAGREGGAVVRSGGRRIRVVDNARGRLLGDVGVVQDRDPLAGQARVVLGLGGQVVLGGVRGDPDELHQIVAGVHHGDDRGDDDSACQAMLYRDLIVRESCATVEVDAAGRRRRRSRRAMSGIIANWPSSSATSARDCQNTSESRASAVMFARRTRSSRRRTGRGT